MNAATARTKSDEPAPLETRVHCGANPQRAGGGMFNVVVETWGCFPSASGDEDVLTLKLNYVVRS